MTAWEQWKAWADSQPKDLHEFESYTVTLLATLARIRDTAPFEWALTGGTALQSTFPVELRRFSDDIDIITTASAKEVTTWMAAQGWQPTERAPNVHSAPLTPRGALYVIHGYRGEDFRATGIQVLDFEHFPLTNQPPEVMRVPQLAPAFLVATKIWGTRDPNRGGERLKDIYDLGIALPRQAEKGVRGMLALYHRVRGDPSTVEETLRQAAVFTRHFSGKGVAEFSAGQNFLETFPEADVKARTAAAAGILEAWHGGARATPVEERRFLLPDVSAKVLAATAKRLGYKGSTSTQLQRLYDWYARDVLPRLGASPAKTAEALATELDGLK